MRNLTTPPRSIIVRNVPDVGQCVITLDAKGRELAYYPARFNGAAIPRIQHVTHDAKWHVRLSSGAWFAVSTTND